MEIRDQRIDAGKGFDWGRTSKEYAKYRDIYPELFYRKITDRGLCVTGQKCLDLGTGTGVLPRNLYRHGAKWIGTDISREQIEQAEILTKQSHMEIEYLVTPAESIPFPPDTFDVVTACQCFWYFDHSRLMPVIADRLKEDGKLLILQMAWLPFEDALAGASEELVLKYSPNWSGAGWTRRPVGIPDAVYEFFELEDHEEYDVMVPFTKETWHGRMKACRGVGASLNPQELESWEGEHRKLLDKIAPEQFEVKHFAAMAVLRVKKKSNR